MRFAYITPFSWPSSLCAWRIIFSMLNTEDHLFFTNIMLNHDTINARFIPYLCFWSYRLCFLSILSEPLIVVKEDIFATIMFFPCHRLGGAVHLCNDESAAHTQLVILKSSHGHLFLPDDIIMEIPIQDRTISMNPDKVKVGSQAWLIKESDATLQVDGLTSDATQRQPLRTCCLCLSFTAWEDTA